MILQKTMKKPFRWNNLLVWQFVPEYPATHAHEYWLTRSVQVPPFWHGELEHSLMSVDKIIILKQSLGDNLSGVQPWKVFTLESVWAVSVNSNNVTPRPSPTVLNNIHNADGIPPQNWTSSTVLDDIPLHYWKPYIVQMVSSNSNRNTTIRTKSLETLPSIFIFSNFAPLPSPLNTLLW